MIDDQPLHHEVARVEHVASAPEVAPAQAKAAAALANFRTAKGQSSATGAAVGEDSDISSDDLIWEGSSKTMTGVGGGRYRLTRYYLHFERGMLSTSGQQISVEHVVDVDVRQTMAQKARGVSDLLVHVEPAGRPRETVQIESITEARDVQQLINEVARARKHEIQRRHRAMQMPVFAQHPSAPVYAAPAPVPSAAAATGNPTVELLQSLAALHASGALTDEEFTAAKKQALGL